MNENRTTRRSVLATIVAGSLAVAAAGASVLVGFVSNTFRGRREREWLRVSRAEELSSDRFKKFVVRRRHRHAWESRLVPLLVYVKDRYPDDPIALLSTCSHLGCSVDWKPEQNEFHCPCHGGVYNARGEVVSGPPPADLTRLEVKFEDEIFFVRPPSDDGSGTS